MAKSTLKSSSKSASKPKAKPASGPKKRPKSTVASKPSPRPVAGAAPPVWLPGRFLRPIEEFYCINEKCSDYKKIGIGNMYHHSWSGGMSEPKRLIKCKTCKKSKSETRWPFPAMPKLPEPESRPLAASLPAPSLPTSPPPLLEGENDLYLEILALQKRGVAKGKGHKSHVNVILDLENEAEKILDDKLEDMAIKIKNAQHLGKIGLNKYIAKALLLRWSREE